MPNGDLLSNANDGFLNSHTASYPDARSGSGTAVIDVYNGNPTLEFGQFFGGGLNYLTETFQEFTLTPVSSNEFCTSSWYSFQGFNRTPNGDPWSAEVRENDWGGTVEAADWVSGDNIPSKTLLAEFPSIRTANPRPYEFRSGSAAMRTRMSGAATLRIMLNSNKTALGLTPDGTHDEFLSINSFEGADGPHRPRLRFTSGTKSNLSYVQGASVQLSDGSHVYLESTVGTPVITLKHSTLSGTVTTIATLAQGSELYQFALGPGQQAFSLERDASDNLFVIGAAGSSVSGICAQAFAKGSGYSWAAKTAISGALPVYDQPVNNCALTWHNVGGTSRLVAVVAHTQGYTNGSTQMVAVSLSNENLLNGSGSPIIATAPIPTTADGLSVNNTGNALDVQAINGGTGIIATVRHNFTNADLQVIDVIYKYTITGSGTFSLTPTDVGGFATGRLADGNLTTQIMPIPGDQNRFYWRSGTTITSYTLTSTGATLNGSAGLISAAIPTLSNPDLAQSLTSLYNPADNKVWIFYIDSGNPRRIMRTAVNCATMLATKEEIEVALNVGASGSVTTLLRTPRGFVDERTVQLHIGNRTAANAHSIITNNYTGFNLFPNPPVLTNPGSFTAESVKIFSWAFSDANPKDRQSAFQLVIRRADTLATVVDTGKVTSTQTAYSLAASTLSNSQSYQWQVRTYDTEDNVSLYSDWQAFSTVTTGIVVITEPDADNKLGLDSPRLTINWTYTITAPLTQAKYRIRVIRTDTNVVIFNSDFITSSDARSFEVQGLLSDVEQAIEIIVQDSSGALSNTFTRLVTPSFSSPNAPGFLATPGDGGIIVTVANPIPTGSLPPAARNDIYRAESGTNNFIKVGEVAPNSQFIDYTVAASTKYDYRVAAVAQGETFSTDVIENVSVEFFGMYIHIPNYPETLRHFLFGGTGNSDQVASTANEMKFVGRTYPVWEFGESLSESVEVDLLIPSEDDNSHMTLVEYVRNIVRTKAVYCYRDSRGRKMFGVVTGSSQKNAPGAMSISLSVRRSDYTEELP